MREETTPADPYVLGRDAREVARLRMQAAAIAADADTLLDRIGVGPGWRCLDLACGVGGITDLLSRRVDPTGSVVGLDVDAGCLAAAREWAARLGLANVEFAQGDAYRTGLEGGSFDLVHVRFFLTTVGGDQALLAEALRLVRPGGVVAFQEADIATLTCYPPLPAWDRIKEAYVALFQRIGADGHVGRRLHFLLRRAGLVDVRFRPFVLGFTHTDPMARFMPDTAASMRHAFRQAGVMTDAELDEAIQACERHLAEPDTISTSYIVYQAWGRKPAATPVMPTQQERWTMDKPATRRRELLRALAVLPVGALVLGPRAARAQTAKPSKTREAIEKGNTQFLDALARGDAAGCAAIYAGNGKVLPPGSPMQTGRKAIEEFWQGAIKGGVKAASLRILELEELGATAIEIGAYTLDIRPEGKLPQKDEGKYVTVWKRQKDGAWKLAVDISNSNLPAS